MLYLYWVFSILPFCPCSLSSCLVLYQIKVLLNPSCLLTCPFLLSQLYVLRNVRNTTELLTLWLPNHKPKPVYTGGVNPWMSYTNPAALRRFSPRNFGDTLMKGWVSKCHLTWVMEVHETAHSNFGKSYPVLTDNLHHKSLTVQLLFWLHLQTLWVVEKSTLTCIICTRGPSVPGWKWTAGLELYYWTVLTLTSVMSCEVF